MPYYVSRGQIPSKRHTQFRSPSGTLYSEEVFGTRGFSGIASILYHVKAPTAVGAVYGPEPINYDPEPQGPLRHRHFFTRGIVTRGDMVSARKYLLKNDDVALGAGVASESMTAFYKNGDGDELLFIHEGSGTLRSTFGTLSLQPGDYVVIPAGTTYQILVQHPLRFVVFEATGPIEIPSRYRNEYGQLLEHAPLCERDLRIPEFADPLVEDGEFPIRVKKNGAITTIVLAHHPFDAVGWDGYLYPYAFNIRDFEPITGRIHQPPPVHQTFQGPNFVICSFVPRLFDYHPLSVPVSYNHSNIHSDEVLYYVKGNFMSRRGIDSGSITLHPGGIPHGPQPGAVEASLGNDRTDELAVMMDTFRPLAVLRPALEIEDHHYMYSWLDRPNST